MRWVKVGGDPYEIGHELGQLAREAFGSVLVRIERYREVLEGWRGSDWLNQLEQAGRQTFPRHMREIEGIADGAGMPFDTVFAWNCRGDLPGGGDQSALAGCTDVMGWGTGGAVAVMAHNEDDQPELDGECFMVEVSPENGRRFISFYSPGLLPGHTFGWNASGLVQTINHLRCHDQRAGVPRHLLCRAVLDCEHLDGALELIRTTSRASGFHHNLGCCGHPPRLVSVEAPASGIAEVEISTWRAHANHLYTPELSGVAQTVAPSSAARQTRADALTVDGLDGADDALAVLADEHNSDWPIRRKRRGEGDPGFTLASCVVQLRPGHLEWRVYRDPRDPPVFQGESRIG